MSVKKNRTIRSFRNNYVYLDVELQFANKQADNENIDIRELKLIIMNAMDSLFGEFGTKILFDILKYRMRDHRSYIRVMARDYVKFRLCLVLLNEWKEMSCKFIIHKKYPTTGSPSINLASDLETLKIEEYESATPRPSPANRCEFWLVSNEGNLTSFGDNSQSVNCVYRVSPLDHTICALELHFDDFDVADARSESKNQSDKQQTIEKEFAQLSADPESCIDNYLEFNNRKRYCHRDWKNRMDVVEIDPNYERDFLFRLVLDRATHSSGFNIRYQPMFNTCKSLAKKIDKLKDADSTLHPVQMMASSPNTAICEKRFTSMEFEIKSNNFPKNYSNNLDCVYYVIRKSDDVCGLELKFVQFDIEESEGCAYDFFEIDGESFCGRLPNGSRNIFKFDTTVKSISFQTDNQVSAPGFHIKVRQVKDCANAFMPVENAMMNNQGRIQKCSIVLHERDGQLSSLKYPESYPKDLLCAYTIERNPKGRFCKIQIDFINFDLQNSKDCNADFFEIENKRYCGKSLEQTRKIIPFNQDGYVRFLFKSDSVESKQGFMMNYTQIACKDSDEQNMLDLSESKSTLDIGQEKNVPLPDSCAQVFQSKKFDLITDSIDGHYKNNQNCQFTVKKFSSKVCYLEMHFKMFDVEASTDCLYDYMEIGNAVRLCGTLNQETSRIYVFDKPEMIITFHTDGNNERKGYHIETEQLECEGDRIIREQENVEEPKEGLQSLEQYKFEQQHHYIQPNSNESQLVLQQQENFVHQTAEFGTPKRKYSQPNSLLCSKTYQQKEFFIHSPGFPGHYQPDLDCLYMIIPYSPNVCKIEINFDSFELQPYDFEKNCLKSDFVDFDNKEQFCGKMPESQTKLYQILANETFFIHFHSDSFRTSFDKGFRLYVRQIECSFYQPTKSQLANAQQQTHCSRIFMSSSFDIQSPLFPSPYPSNSYCDYRIVKFKSPGVNICFLEVNFVEFDLQSSPNCNRDYISFNGIKLCGSVGKDSVRLFPFYDNEFTISFYSDPVVNGRGFFLKVRQNECPPTPTIPDVHSLKRPKPSEESSLNYQIIHANQNCQRTFSSIYFEFESPNYPQYYLPSLGCVYTIQRQNNHYCKLELFIVDFDVESSSGCLQDYLLIDNVKYCNSNRPNTIIQLSFYEPEKRIYFRSASFRPRKGFMIQARQLECDNLIPGAKTKQQTDVNNIPSTNSDLYPENKFIFLPSLPSICEICVTEVTGHIQSYDYPNFYPPNVNCTYRIAPLPDNCMVQLRFGEFDFDYSAECNQDYLEINGIRYCGHQLKGVSMLLLNKRKDDLIIRMVTSSKGAVVKPSYRGFRASYIQLPCLDTTKTDGQPNQIPQIQPATKSVSIHSADQQMLTKQTNNQPNRKPMSGKTNMIVSSTPATVPNEPIYCDQTFDDKVFEIKSPGYPYRYFDDLDCSYLIRKNSANVCRLKVTFNYFNVIGEDGSCRGDYFDLFNTRFCGVLDRYTNKEIPFMQEKILLHFHSNQHQTANGFHLTLEQVDCIAVQPLSDNNGHHKGKTRKENSYMSKTSPQRSKHPSNQPDQQQQQQPPNYHQTTEQIRQQQHPTKDSSSFKYDDDEIISDFDTRNKATVEVKPQVIYEDYGEHVTTTKSPEDSTQNKLDKPTRTKGNSHHPPKFFSPNITVMDEKGPEGEVQIIKPMVVQSTIMPIEQDHRMDSDQMRYTSNKNGGQSYQHQQQYQDHHSQQQQQQYQDHHPQQQQQQYQDHHPQQQQQYQDSQPQQHHIDHQHSTQKLCEQKFIQKVFFELKASDLKMTKNGAFCQLQIHKAKSNICQLDVMFIRYNLNDTTCNMQYLSLDGERVCGRVHEFTTKRYWFNNPEVDLMVKLNQMGEISDDTFEIKARQVECAANVDVQRMQKHQQRPMNEMPMSSYHVKPIDSNDNQYSTKNIQRDYPTQNVDRHVQQLEQTKQHTKPEKETYTMRPFKDKDHPHNQIGNNVQQQEKAMHSESESGPFNPYCDLIENEMNFKIESPHEPGATRCRYTIRKASDKVCAIDIKFEMFILNEAMKCDLEYMEIDSSRICGAFPIGHERRYYFMPNEYEKMIYFTTSKSLNNPGDFKLDIKQIEDCEKPATQKPSLMMPTICDISVRNYKGNIKSPNYPAPYGDFTKCIYRIQAIGEDYCSVKLRIRDIDIEPDSLGSSRCDKDWLELDSQKLCGNRIEQTEYTIPFEIQNGHKMAQIKFTSDAFGNGRGFDIEYKQELCVKTPLKPNLISPGNKGLSMESRFRTQPKPTKNVYPPSSIKRPQYPPNYVSKAHMLKTMDRKEFIKMMLMDKEREKMNISTEKDDTKTTNNMMMMSTTGASMTTINEAAMTTMTTSLPDITTITPIIDTIDSSTDLNVITTEAPVTTNSDISM